MLLSGSSTVPGYDQFTRHELGQRNGSHSTSSFTFLNIVLTFFLHHLLGLSFIFRKRLDFFLLVTVALLALLDALPRGGAPRKGIPSWISHFMLKGSSKGSQRSCRSRHDSTNKFMLLLYALWTLSHPCRMSMRNCCFCTTH